MTKIDFTRGSISSVETLPHLVLDREISMKKLRNSACNT